VLKDNDFVARGERISLGAGRRDAFVAQLTADAAFLDRMAIMDYSLLLGVHNVDADSAAAAAAARAARARARAPAAARDSGVPSAAGDRVYYLGIIDILQQFGLRKAGERAIRAVYQPVAGISSVSPPAYAKRFVQFIADHTD
jgi:1-phosphatidylinositol-4-phosphate 5-kinase